MDNPKLFAFVLMPFDKKFEDVYRLGIKGAADKFDDLIAERVDDQIYREGILERIYRQIELADIIIADMSEQNPNVFYEVGYAHAKQKLCILLTANVKDIPFDLKHRRHIVYDSIVTLSRELEKELRWALDELDKQRKSDIKLTCQPLDGMGALERTKYFAEADIPFTIDLENTSDERAINIDAIYFYSRAQWNLFQDSKKCAFSAADQPFAAQGFERRHFLQPPLQVMQKGAWAQIKFNVRGILATAYKGEQLQESYHMRGRGIIRLLTARGNFDYDIPIDVEVNELPF